MSESGVNLILNANEADDDDDDEDDDDDDNDDDDDEIFAPIKTLSNRLVSTSSRSSVSSVSSKLPNIKKLSMAVVGMSTKSI